MVNLSSLLAFDSNDCMHSIYIKHMYLEIMFYVVSLVFGCEQDNIILKCRMICHTFKVRVILRVYCVEFQKDSMVQKSSANLKVYGVTKIII